MTQQKLLNPNPAEKEAKVSIELTGPNPHGDKVQLAFSIRGFPILKFNQPPRMENIRKKVSLLLMGAM